MARKKVELRQLKLLPVEQVVPSGASGPAPREAEIEALARALAERKLAPPVLVRDDGRGSYALVAGALTHAAVLRLGWTRLDCIVAGPEAGPELDVVERIQRESINPWEAADALQALKLRYGWTQSQLGLAIGKTRDFIANLLAITQIAPEVRETILRHHRGGEVTMRHLRYIARTPRSDQMRAAQRLLAETISTKALEREKRFSTRQLLAPNVIRVRPLRDTSGIAPRSANEWRRYHRQLVTDLRRIDRQESAEKRRTLGRLAEAKQRLKLVRAEANRKRRQLGRELRNVKKQLYKLGS